MKRKNVTFSPLPEDHKELQKKAELKRAYMEAAADDARNELFQEWSSIDEQTFTFIFPTDDMPKPGVQ